MTLLFTLIGTIVFAVVGPALGCLLAGLDRIIARMQGRVGPRSCSRTTTCASFSGKNAFPSTQASSSTSLFARCSSRFSRAGSSSAAVTFLLCVFVVTLSGLFFIVAAYSSRSPYAEIGAARETIQVMAYEPMVLLFAVAFFMAVGSFDISAVLGAQVPAIATIWLVPRPSFHSHDQAAQVAVRSFDVASRSSGARSRHDHRDERADSRWSRSCIGARPCCSSGGSASSSYGEIPLSIILAALVTVVVYFLEIWIDNNFARVKWQFMLKSAWGCRAGRGGVNLSPFSPLFRRLYGLCI